MSNAVVLQGGMGSWGNGDCSVGQLLQDSDGWKMGFVQRLRSQTGTGAL